MNTIEKYKITRQELFDAAGVQPESKFVAINGPVKKVHYLKAGSKKPLVLIHGGGSHSSEWINIIKPLAEHLTVFVVDRPGCGLSETIDYRGVSFRESAGEFIRLFMDAAELKRAFIMGNSMGGYFGICFALAYPERVEKLFLIGAPAGMNLWIPSILRVLGTRGLNGLLLNTVGKPSISGVRNFHKQLLVADINKLSDAYIKHGYFNQLLPGTMKSFCTLLENVLTLKGWRKDLYLGDKLNTLKVPVHFIWGDRDAFEKPETGIQKAEAIENHTFAVVENAGHCPWLDQPERCASLITTLL